MIIPNRVVFNSEGDAVPYFRAKDCGVDNLSVIFKREDGWTLAAPKSLELVAFSLWKGDWTHFSKDGETWEDISSYFK